MGEIAVYVYHWKLSRIDVKRIDVKQLNLHSVALEDLHCALLSVQEV